MTCHATSNRHRRGGSCEEKGKLQPTVTVEVAGSHVMLLFAEYEKNRDEETLLRVQKRRMTRSVRVRAYNSGNKPSPGSAHSHHHDLRDGSQIPLPCVPNNGVTCEMWTVYTERRFCCTPVTHRYRGAGISRALISLRESAVWVCHIHRRIRSYIHPYMNEERPEVDLQVIGIHKSVISDQGFGRVEIVCK